MVERIEEKSPGGPEDRKTSIPDSRFFKELMVQKTGEVELEKRKKRQIPHEEEEEENEETQPPSPYDTTYYSPPPESEDPEDSLPASPEFWDGVQEPKDDTSKKVKHKKGKKEKLGKKKKTKKGEKESIGMEGLHHPKEVKTETLPGMEKMKKKKAMSKEETKTSLLSIPTKAEDEKKALVPEEKTHLKKGEKEVFPSPHEKKEKKSIQWPAQLPTHIENTSSAITAKAHPYLEASSALPLLFHQMVGTIILMRSKGVSTTEVILNSPKFETSDLFGARIVIEKYSTAPESYNVRLIGNPRAVAIFDENLESLQAAFKNSNLDFSVNLLRTEHEREKFLFHRKEGVAKDEKEKKDKKR